MRIQTAEVIYSPIYVERKKIEALITQ